MRRTMMGVLAAMLVMACSSGTEPPRYSGLKHRIVKGEAFALKAGTMPTETVDLSYRELLAQRIAPQDRLERLAARIVLPAVALAQGGSTTITVQPGAVACVASDQTDVAALYPCVTADTAGHSRFDWSKLPTKAGTYTVHIGSSYGRDTTTLVTVTFTVAPGAPLKNFVRNYSVDPQPSPVVLAAASVVDAYANPVPFRVKANGHIAANDTTLGTAAARTITLAAQQVDTVLHAADLTGDSAVVVAKLVYRVVTSGNETRMRYLICGTNVSAATCTIAP